MHFKIKIKRLLMQFPFQLTQNLRYFSVSTVTKITEK